jgi:hypothetical protein
MKLYAASGLGGKSLSSQAETDAALASSPAAITTAILPFIRCILRPYAPISQVPGTVGQDKLARCESLRRPAENHL